jgi:exodeoxyribonuclease VII large subunit
MRPAGLGALYEAFERLKKTLESEGLFDASKKRPLPFIPQQIGIVTSLQAAALRDVLTTLRRRMSGIPVVVYPVPVQGEGAGLKIAQAIETANARAECDVLIVCRGGGSIEDLWAFNEEVVARAIAASAIPVISGVGHETDFTIADFAADVRAATPTAAAQLAVPDRAELSSRLDQFQRQLAYAIQRRFEQVAQRLDFAQRRLVHPVQKIQQQTQYLSQLRQRLRHTAQRLLESHAARLHAMQQHLSHLDPKQVLARGYSMVRDEQGGIITDAAALSVGTRLEVVFAQGEAGVEVTDL